MAVLRKINLLLSMLLILMALALLYNKVFKVQLVVKHHVLYTEQYESKDNRAPNEAVKHVSELETDIPVVICASEDRVGATMATINSVYSNTQAIVFFYIVTLREAVQWTRQYIEKTKLKNIKYKILEFNPMVLKGKVRPDSSRPDLLHPLNIARFYLPQLAISNHKRIVYLDDDVIVQGDIKELYQIKLQPGHAVAFASDCDLPGTYELVHSVGMQTSYMDFLDYRKQAVRELGINPTDCSFNPGVFVADVDEWKKQKITLQLEKWMSKNFLENLYSSAMAGGVATPPMLIVFHNKYATIDPKWHVRHLGWSPDADYPKSMVREAHLLHWNGRFKPWRYPCVHLDLWEKWFIPDPSGKFVLVRPET